MARASNLYGVTVGSKGTARNGALNIQALEPATPIQERVTAYIRNPSKSVGATSPCAAAPADDRDIFAEQGGTLTPEQEALLTPRIRNIPVPPVQRLNVPDGQNSGNCGPDLRSAPSQPRISPIGRGAARIEPPIIVATPPVPNYLNPCKDWINISNTKTTGNEFKPVMDSGVGTSPFRPEIITLTDFIPLYMRGDILKLSDSGLFVDVQYQAQKLRQETLAKMIANIQKANDNTAADEQFAAFVKDYENTIKKLDEDLSVANDIQGKIASIRNILDIKQIPDAQYDSKLYSGLKAFATENMQYSPAQLDIFSNTKILAQLLFDLKSTLENYSVGLLDLTDPDRPLDRNPVTIDKSYTISSGFDFTLASLAAKQTGINATDPNFVNAFLSSLPSKKLEVIKILSVLICKELASSKAFGNRDVQTIVERDYGAKLNSNVYSSIIGDVGADIFQNLGPKNSLMSLLQTEVPGNTNVKILPFENKYVDADNNNSVFVPGSSYYADSIFDIESDSPGWNTKPIIDYVTNLELTVNKATDVLTALLGYSGTEELYATELIKNMYLELGQALYSQINPKLADKDGAILSALVALAEKDNRLKNMLFQYVLLVGMRTNDTPQESTAFEILAQELGSVSALSYARLDSSKTDNRDSVRLPRGERVFSQYLESMVVAIEKRAYKIAMKTGKNSAEAQKNAEKNKNAETKDSSKLEITLKPGNIAAALRNATKTDKSFTIVRSFSENFTRLINAAMDNGVSNFLADSVTRTSGLSMSTLSLMLFELCSAFYVSYTNAVFEDAQTGPKVVVDLKKNSDVVTVLYELARRNVALPTYENIVGSVEVLATNPNLSTQSSTTGLADDQISDQAKKTELYSLLTKVADEQLYPANALYILQLIKAYIRNNATSTLSFFQQNKMQVYLTNNSIDSDKLEIMQNPSQLRVSMHVLDNIKSLSPTKLIINEKTVNAPTNKLVLSDTLTKNEYSLIKLMMSENPFLPEANYSPEKQIKVLSVGIPSGFTKQLVDRVNVQDIGSTSFRNRQSDIIDILVYKRDLRFEDIVFKPLSFSFDMSLFVDQASIDSITVDETKNFSEVIRNIPLSDYSFGSNGSMQKRLLPYSEVIKNDEYRYALPMTAQIRAMFQNHVISYILDMYTSLLTGLKIDETTFIQTQSKPERSVDKEIFQMIYTYVKDVLKQPLPPAPPSPTPQFITETIQSILLDETASEEVKDYFRLFTYGTIAFNKEYVTSLVNQPKIFDRVFHVPVDLSAFEVDLDATLSTESGRQAFEQTYVQDSLYRTESGAYKLKNKTATDLVFEDYFVRIETAIDKD
jgi:hypothetical protein